MKIIDILNKMANEELKDGFKFKYMGFTYIYKKWEDRIAKADEDFTDFTDDWHIEEVLNDEVEVIEEKKEIKRLDEKDFYDFNHICLKLNEVIRTVNKLTKESEEK